MCFLWWVSWLTCIRPPSLWRNSCEWCTYGSAGKQPQIPDSLIVPTELQTPDYWRSSDYSLRQTQIYIYAWVLLWNRMRKSDTITCLSDSQDVYTQLHIHPIGTQTGWLTWRNLTYCGRVPAIPLVTVRTLDENSTVAQTLSKHLTPDVIQTHTSAWRKVMRLNRFSLFQKLWFQYLTVHFL